VTSARKLALLAIVAVLAVGACSLMTVFVDPSGEVQGIPHAEWSVRTVWS
jgi:hypothetical protein